jgi:hypothetical protein
MPDRYGDDADPDIARITDPYRVANCDLCDDNGYRGGTVCDHYDRQEAAVRGMRMIREAMGWEPR